MAIINLIEPFEPINFDSAQGTGAAIVAGTVLSETWAAKAVAATTATSAWRAKSYASTGTNVADTNFPSATTYCQFDFAYVTKPGSNDEELLSLYGASTIKFVLRLNSSGNLVAYNGTTLLATGTTALSASTKYRIRWNATDGTGGAWAVFIDGNAETNLSGTANFSTTVSTTIHFGKFTNRNGQGIEFYYANIAYDSAAYPDSGAVVSHGVADGNGTYTGWTGDYTPEWTEGSPVTTDDADASQYVATSENPLVETATMESCATMGVSGTIHAIKAVAMVRRVGASAVAIKVRMRSNTTDTDTTTGADPGTSYRGWGKIFETDPGNGNIAWTTTNVDAVEVGCQHVQAQAREARCTAVFLEVLYTPAAGSVTRTPTVGSATITGVAPRWNLGLIVPTQVDP